MRKAGEKCGNCRFFVARNVEEAKLATYAKNEAECGPGEWVFQGRRKVGCHGGPVYGQCMKWKERHAQSPRVASTFWCHFWRPGGPRLKQSGGSLNALSGDDGTPIVANSILMVLGSVFALGVTEWFRMRGVAGDRPPVIGFDVPFEDFEDDQ